VNVTDRQTDRQRSLLTAHAYGVVPTVDMYLLLKMNIL